MLSNHGPNITVYIFFEEWGQTQKSLLDTIKKQDQQIQNLEIKLEEMEMKLLVQEQKNTEEMKPAQCMFAKFMIFKRNFTLLI